MCQIHIFPTNFQYFCKSAPIELSKTININIFSCDAPLDRFETTLVAEPTPKTAPKSSFLNVRKNIFFQRIFKICWSLHTSTYRSFLTWSYTPSWPVLGPTKSHLEPSWSHLSLPKPSQHRSKTPPKTTSNLAPSWGPTSRPSRAQNSEKTNEKTIKKNLL